MSNTKTNYFLLLKLIIFHKIPFSDYYDITPPDLNFDVPVKTIFLVSVVPSIPLHPYLNHLKK